MAQSFFEQVEDALVGFLPRTLRTFSSQRTGRNLKVWYGGDTREHYEVQMIARGRRGPELEVGFHAEHRAQARNDAVLSWFEACASEWRRTLGKTVRSGPFVGGQWPAWRGISELWTGPNLMGPESAVEAAHRLVVVHPSPRACATCPLNRLGVIERIVGQMPSSEWIDVSVVLRDGMIHWPGDPPVSIARFADIAKGDTANVSRLSMGAHTGTHMDAPLHFVADGRGLDEMDPSATIGPARVIEIEDPESIRSEELERHDLRAGERVLFRTRNSSYVWTEGSFVEDFVYISTDAARYLAERGVLAVGVDYLSVGGFGRDDIGETHRLLLAGGVWIIEGLDLRSVGAGDYELVCLPLRIERSDGAPARAVVRPLH